ncbi:MAG: dienelactone hydrolase family protein [Bryobacterales bacterium]|nr:dienelactone hydrolase family protein [Bryobacterales bacterium]
MVRKKASDFPQELLDLFDLYVHGDIDRRAFLDRAKRFATTGVTAAMLLESLNPRFAEAQQIRTDDPRIEASRVTVPSPNGLGEIRGYLVKPANAAGRLPGVVVVHENRGLNPHTEDVTRRMALENFVAFAPDGLTTLGGYPGDEDTARSMFAKIDRSKLMEDFIASSRWLKSHPACTGKIGVVGFCFGAGVANGLAVNLGAELSAAAPFYGGQAPASEVPKIQAPLQLHFASLDTRVNEGWPAYEAALKANGKRYTMFMYEGGNHGFLNDTTPRYDEAMAKLAWSRTVEFFNAELR